MKANQSFKQNDEAVSPVIGVILMVAITVVLAAVVFVLVGNLTETGDDAPTIAFIKNEQTDNLTVSSVSWAGTALEWDADIDTVGCTEPGGTVSAGDVLDCSAGTVTVSHVATQTLLYTTTFS